METKESTENDQVEEPNPHEQAEISESLTSRHCLVCFYVFNKKGKRPRTLPCGHSFCSECISKSTQDRILSCPNCREKYKAPSTDSFPVNFILEKLVTETLNVVPEDNSQKSDSEKSLKPTSKRLQSHKAVAFAEAEALSYKIDGLKSQLQEYALQLKEWVDTHQHSFHQIEDILQQIKEEDQKIEMILGEEARARSEMETAINSLKSTNSLSETIQAIENMHMHFENLEEWLETTAESFPNRELVIHSKKLREQCPRGSVNPISSGDVNEEYVDRSSSHHQDVTSEASDGGQHESSPYEKFPNSPMTIQEKINSVLSSVPCGFGEKAFQNQCNSQPKGLESVSQCESKEQRLSQYETKATQTESEESLHLYTKAEDVVVRKWLLKQLLQRKNVLAFQEGKERGKKLYARLSLDEKNRVLLHALSEDTLYSKNPPAIIKHEEILRHVSTDSRLTFLEFGVDGRSLGRVFISLIDEGLYPENFHWLCTGRKEGLSFRHSNILKVFNKGESKEYILLGDYEKNDGNGGKTVLPRVYSLQERERQIYKNSQGIGLLMARTPETVMSQLYIYTGYTSGAPCFGKVEEGLYIIREAISRYYYDNIQKVKIIDCGVILYK